MGPKDTHKQNSTSLNGEQHLLIEHIRNAYSQFEDKLAQLSILRELGMTLLHINDFKQVCQTILEIIIKNTVAKNCSIMLMDHDQNRLFLIAATNQDGETYLIDAKKILSKDDVQYTFAPGEGAAGEAVVKKAPVLIEDVEQSDIYAFQKETKVKIGALLSVPLIIEDAVTGVLTLSHSAKGAFETNDINLFNIVANFVVLAINSTLSYQRLQYSEEKYRALAEYSNDGITIIKDDIHQYANPSYESLSGYGFAELSTIPLSDLISTKSDATDKAHPDTPRNSDMPGTYEAVMISKSGEKIDIEISHAPFMYEGRAAKIISVRDLRERKELESQLRQAQKMEAIGTLAGGVAHDFNNLLQGIHGYAQLMLMDKAINSTQRKRLEQIECSAKRAAEHTHQLLTLSRKAEGKLQPMDINTEVIHVKELLQHTIPKTTQIDVQLAQGLKITNANPSQIGQVLINLGINANDAMPEGGTLTIKTENIILDEAYCHNQPEAKPGDYILITVSDTGEGIDKDTIDHIFEPFFTTKQAGKGTGLGLAMVYGIVKSHHGHITCSSVPGHGTTFHVYLPILGKEIAQEEVDEEYSYLCKGSETILAVDDEEIVLDFLQTALEELGYNTILASNGLDGIEAYKSAIADGRTIDMVILDMNMPVMNGLEAFREIRGIDPNAKVLLATGFGECKQTQEILSEGILDSIHKPFTLLELSNKIRTILKPERDT
jgi:PAS domain S-box-containing protein